MNGDTTMKKALSMSLVCIMLIAMLTACGTPKNKVTVNIDINGTVTKTELKTTEATLEDVFIANQKELGLTLTDSDYGKFISGAGGYIADPAKNEFIEVLVNDVSSQVGIKEIIIADGDVYTLKLSTF